MPEKRIIYKDEFNNLLLRIFDISQKERDFLNKYFAYDLIDGLTEWELQHKIASLKFDKKDPISSEDAESVKQKILEAMGKK